MPLFSNVLHALQWNHTPYRNDAFSSLYPNTACQWPLRNSKSVHKLLHLWNYFFRACNLLPMLLPTFCTPVLFFDIKYNHLTTLLLPFQLSTFSWASASGECFLSLSLGLSLSQKSFHFGHSSILRLFANLLNISKVQFSENLHWARNSVANFRQLI